MKGIVVGKGGRRKEGRLPKKKVTSRKTGEKKKT